MTLLLALAFSLGVHLLALLSFGLVEAGTPQVRAYRWFVGTITLWLMLALLAEIGVFVAATRPLAGTVAHFLPLVLLLGGSVPNTPPPRWLVASAIAIAALLLPFTVSVSPWHHGTIELAYYGLAWTLAGIAVFGAMRGNAPANASGRWTMAKTALVSGALSIGLLVGLGALAGIALVSAMLVSVVLYATVRLSLYTVRAGASRSGALATEAAELDRRAIAWEIAAIVAHEVRNPLTGVRSLAQQLSDGTASEERRRRYADLIVSEVDRVERMVSALLGASSSRGPMVAGETSVAELFDDVALLVSERFRRAGVILTVDSATMRVATPREPLAQALLNLLMNAVQQAPVVKRVRLCARAAADVSGTVELLVEDDGAGVPGDQREAIWAPLHSGTSGSGLGLAVVRRLAEQWGWNSTVRDTGDGGATFVLVVPALAARHEPLTATAHAKAGVPESPHRSDRRP